MLERLSIPIVQAPLAGGPSTPELAAAVSNAGALGFVAAGYKTPEAMAEEIAATRALTRGPFGVNVFAAEPTVVPRSVLDAFAGRVREATGHTGVEPGAPRSDDDRFDDKLAALLADPVPLVSFTFGSPSRDVVGRLQAAGSQVWVTVTDVEEARTAAAAGADALVLQGVEAGGHRGAFDDAEPGDYGVLALIQLVSAAVELPLVASGGIATGAAVAAVLCAGAGAAQLGTAFMRCPEAGTVDVHRQALAAPGRTALTRAFTGRMARGIVNGFLAELSADAPRAYPAVHHLTAPIRAQGRKTGDHELLNLWAGQAHELARDLPARDLVRRLDEEARTAIERCSAAPPARRSRQRDVWPRISCAVSIGTSSWGQCPTPSSSTQSAWGSQSLRKRAAADGHGRSRSSVPHTIRTGHVIRSASRSPQPTRSAWSIIANADSLLATPSIWWASSSAGMCSKFVVRYCVAPRRPAGEASTASACGAAVLTCSSSAAWKPSSSL